MALSLVSVCPCISRCETECKHLLSYLHIITLKWSTRHTRFVIREEKERSGKMEGKREESEKGGEHGSNGRFVG